MQMVRQKRMKASTKLPRRMRMAARREKREQKTISPTEKAEKRKGITTTDTVLLKMSTGKVVLSLGDHGEDAEVRRQGSCAGEASDRRVARHPGAGFQDHRWGARRTDLAPRGEEEDLVREAHHLQAGEIPTLVRPAQAQEWALLRA